MKAKTVMCGAIALAFLNVSCDDTPKAEKAGFSGEDLTGKVRIVRDKYTKTAAIQVDQDMEWTLYSGPSVAEIDFTQPLMISRADGTFPLEVPADRRSYFEFATETGTAILAERHLPITGGYNFRDLGGYRTADGRYVKWGKFFRADELHNLTDADMHYLESIPLVSVVDFRSPEEVSQAPDIYPSTVTGKYPYSIDPGNIMGMIGGQIPSAEQAASMMEEMNRMMVTDAEIVGIYRNFFSLLQQEDNLPLLFHCSAGKDRTGMAAALILFALGVDEQTIMEDYLLSNHYLGDKYAPLIEQYPQLKPMMEVQQSFLQAGIDQMRSSYGSVEAYLTGPLGVDLEQFRSKYLY